MGKRKDFAVDMARNAYDTIQGGISREVAVNFLAQVIRTAHSRGAIEGARANGAAKAGEKLV